MANVTTTTTCNVASRDAVSTIALLKAATANANTDLVITVKATEAITVGTTAAIVVKATVDTLATTTSNSLFEAAIVMSVAMVEGLVPS